MILCFGRIGGRNACESGGGNLGPGVCRGSTVSRRTNEIGIRIALGARPVNVLSIVLADTGVAVVMGAAAGLLGAGFTAVLIRRMLDGIGPVDPVSTGAGILVTIVMATAAAHRSRSRDSHLELGLLHYNFSPPIRTAMMAF